MPWPLPTRIQVKVVRPGECLGCDGVGGKLFLFHDGNQSHSGVPIRRHAFLFRMKVKVKIKIR